MAETNVVLVGHSFLRRLRDNLTPITQRNLELGQVEGLFLARGGMTIQRMERELDRIPSRFQGIIFLQIGDNDIGAMVPWRSTATAIQSAVMDIARRWKSSMVLVGTLFPRYKDSRYIQAEIYNRKMKAINEALLTEEMAPTNLTVWDHSHHFKIKQKLFCGDGVHLSAIGEKKLYNSIRKALATHMCYI